VDGVSPSSNDQDAAPGEAHADSLGLMVRDLHRLITKSLLERVGQFGLSAHSCAYLATIGAQGGATPKELSDFFSVRSQSTLGVLRLLETKRLIKRFSDPNDARRTYYRLTARGVEVERLTRQCALDVEHTATKELNGERLVQFYETVAIIRKSLGEMMERGHETTGLEGAEQTEP
jgi:DNA-binding MarR family transcriptional regulator